MIDVLLINPTTIRTYKKVSADIISMPPLGLLYLGTYIKKKGYSVSIIDFSVNYYSLDEFISKLKELTPKIIGISTFTECYSPTKILIKLIKQLLPNIYIIAGGPGATFSYQKYFDETDIDFIIRGEGEFSLCHLIENIFSKKHNYNSIEGLVYKENNNLVVNSMGRRISNQDDLGWPDRSLLDLSKYIYPYTISTSRGCPGNCMFCSSRQYWGKEIHFRSPESIIEEIKFLIKNYNLEYFFIIDDTFTMIPKRVFKFIELLEENNIYVTWGCESRADVVTYELLQKMYESGCRKLQFGLESANNEILRKIGKKITRENVLNAVKIARSIGIDVNVSFIIGHVYDTKKTIEDTLEFALFLFKEYKINPYCAINTPYPGTVLYENPEKFRMKILTDNFDNYTMDNPIIVTSNFTPNDLRKYYQSFQNVCLGKEEKLFFQ